MALFSKFFGRTISEAAAFALGGAMRSPLEPPLVELTNETWTKFVDAGITVPTEPGDAAEIAAERVDSIQWAKDQGKQRGYGEDQMQRLIDAVKNAPGLPELFHLWRRGLISDALFAHGLDKARLEDDYKAPLEGLKPEILSPAQIALGIVRSLLADPGLMPVQLDTSGGTVPAYPTSSIDALTEAQGSGIDRERLRVMVGEIGRPMSPEAAAQSLFRNIIERPDYNRAILEGDTRPEWGDSILEHAREIPSVPNFIEGYVRNWITREQMLAGAARHGMTEEDANLIFLIHGRPLTHNQVFIGLLRGGVYDGPTDMIDPAFLKSLQESDMRPEWYNLAWHARFHFPPFFQTINALNKNWIDAPTAKQWLLWQAYDPDAVDTIVNNVASSKAAPADKHVTSAQTRTITAIMHAYLSGQLTDAAAESQLEQAGLSASSAQGVVAQWSQQKAVNALPPVA